VDVKVVLPGGRSLSGTVPGLYGDVLGSAAYSRVHPRHRIAAWVLLLALSAAYPDRGFTAVTIGRARSGADDGASATIARIPTLRHDAALEHLATLVDLWVRGMREPLPVACAASAAYAQAARDGRNAVASGQREWESGWRFPKEDADLEHQLAFGGVLAFADLLDEAPRADESGDGWEASETTRFGRLARRLWDGLLACERLDDQ
jgi:exodeoxyribonuclease V gamma subunit